MTMKKLLIVALGIAALGVSAGPASALLSAQEVDQLCLNQHLAPETPEFKACVANYFAAPDAAPAPPANPIMDAATERRSAECRSYGAEPGSQVYVNCMIQLSSRDASLQQQREQAEQEDAARQRELDFRRRAALADMIRNSYKPAPVMLPPPQPVYNPGLSCTSNAIGQYTYTNCH